MTLSGPIEPSYVAALGGRLRVLADVGAVTIDMTQVTPLPPEAVSVLLRARMLAHRVGTDLHFAADPASVAGQVRSAMGLPVAPLRDTSVVALAAQDGRLRATP